MNPILTPWERILFSAIVILFLAALLVQFAVPEPTRARHVVEFHCPTGFSLEYCAEIVTGAEKKLGEKSQ